MSDDRQAPGPEIAQIAAALERLGMHRPPRPPGLGGPSSGPGGAHEHPRHGHSDHGHPDRTHPDHAHPDHEDPRDDGERRAQGDRPALGADVAAATGRPADRGHGGRERGRGGPRAAMGARRLLQALAAASGARSITELGQAIGVDQPRASRLVQALADAGLVRRIADPDDGRRTVVELTAAGRRHVDAHVEARASQVAIAARALTAEERATLAALLARLADAWPAP